MSTCQIADLELAAGMLNREAAALPLVGRLRLIADTAPGPIVFTTSFGVEDQAITHALVAADVAKVTLKTLDTGRLFPETYALWAETERSYPLRILGVSPKQDSVEDLVARDGPDGFYRALEARKSCCQVRKVEPLARALAGAKSWITGLRGDQSAQRATVEFAEIDPARGVLKLNPLFDWTRSEVVAFVTVSKVPINPLHQAGFVSIGCAPCTRAILPGEPERAGRWWWEDETKKECGLHIAPDGRLSRPEPAGGALA